ncbi:Monosaccharide ABC transporter membrane protein (CUT2 family) [Paraburkholderia sacchari]|uniref:ABC transporter permease n=1 Tax=Paraburkholderia sacchari TaxID=159450 RepID=UPI0039A466D3
METKREFIADRPENLRAPGRNRVSRRASSSALAVARIVVPLLVLLGLAEWASPAFLTPDNLMLVLRQVSITGLTALGVTFVVICGRFDLSVGSLLTLSGVVLISLHEAVGPGVAIAVCLFIGLLVGCVNGLLVAVLGLDSLIATLGMLSVLQGAALIFTGGKNEYVMNPHGTWFNFVGRGYIHGVPFPVILLVICAVILAVVLQRTVFGRQVFAVGGNGTASFFSGIAARRTIFFAYVISGVMTAIATIVFGSRVMAVQTNSGSGLEMNVLAAIILGGTSLSGGAGSIARSIVGVVALGLLQNWLLLIGLPYQVQWIVTWGLIVAAVWFNESQKRGRLFV